MLPIYLLSSTTRQERRTNLRRLLSVAHRLLNAVLLAACASAPNSLPTLTPVATPVPGGETSLAPAHPCRAMTARPGGLYVDAAQRLGPISPLVYGTNYGPWVFVPLQMQPQAEAARLTFVRFPGGNWGDQNNLDERQIDQFIAFARQLGAEPSISVRLKGGTPEQAAALVRFVNVTQGYGVRYWSIGNEPSLYGDDYDTERYNQEWRRWAEAMLAVDPAIQLIGPDIHQFTAEPQANPKDSAGRDWMTEFLKANGDRVAVVAFHRYAFPKSGLSGSPTIEDLRANSREWEAIIPFLRNLIRETAGRDLPVAVTEVNSSWAVNTGGEATLDSHYNAIWWADSLGRMIRHGVDIVAQFALIGQYGLMGKYEVYPIYYVYLMYQRFGTERIYAASDDPDVSIFAARRADGALTLMMINLASEPVEKTLTLANVPNGQAAETWLFDAAHPAEPVDPVPLGSPAALRLPPESMLLIITQP